MEKFLNLAVVIRTPDPGFHGSVLRLPSSDRFYPRCWLRCTFNLFPRFSTLSFRSLSPIRPCPAILLTKFNFRFRGKKIAKISRKKKDIVNLLKVTIGWENNWLGIAHSVKYILARTVAFIVAQPFFQLCIAVSKLLHSFIALCDFLN